MPGRPPGGREPDFQKMLGIAFPRSHGPRGALGTSVERFGIVFGSCEGTLPCLEGFKKRLEGFKAGFQLDSQKEEGRAKPKSAKRPSKK